MALDVGSVGFGDRANLALLRFQLSLIEGKVAHLLVSDPSMILLAVNSEDLYSSQRLVRSMQKKKKKKKKKC